MRVHTQLIAHSGRKVKARAVIGVTRLGACRGVDGVGARHSKTREFLRYTPRPVWREGAW